MLKISNIREMKVDAMRKKITHTQGDTTSHPLVFKNAHNIKCVRMWSNPPGLSYIAAGNAKWYNHFRRQFGSFLGN